MALPSAEPIASLYVHVPFCVHKCAYCAFYSEPAGGELLDRYISALIRELELVAPDLRPRTVYFGGGTPSLLTVPQWERIFQAMDNHHLSDAAEWTVECNPATVSLEKARFLRSCGVNRLSLGVQSFDDTLLSRLGRIHTRQMAFQSFDALRRAGFDNLNLDLMFAIPGQTLEVWRETLNEATAMACEHLSSYEVIYEEDTPLYEQLQAGKADADEDLACAMYEALVERATGAGFQQYEVANFARDATPNPQPSNFNVPTHACRHNVNYWRGGPFYGLGPSATTYVRGVRTKTSSNTQLYCDDLEQGRRSIESREELPPLSRAGETAAFGLRMVAGWPFQEFLQTTGYDLRREWANELDQLVEQGWGCILPDRFHLTSQGLRFADAAAQLFLR
ncbi:MAG TPA: radical SAM family heme chaperone HemW [Candidatus Paceibacterota bacterium]|nr:radical SAM family heme chaperone HemW [Verrucomicrobiota bacterium]HSA11217.1 radical SAM family heme chaperone HemW [Candidatus Paceibacterota bacterium]